MVQFLPTILVALPNTVEVVDARTEEEVGVPSLVLGGVEEGVTAKLPTQCLPQVAVAAEHGVSMGLPLMLRAVQAEPTIPLLVVLEPMVLAVTLDVVMAVRAVGVAWILVLEAQEETVARQGAEEVEVEVA